MVYIEKTSNRGMKSLTLQKLLVENCKQKSFAFSWSLYSIFCLFLSLSLSPVKLEEDVCMINGNRLSLWVFFSLFASHKYLVFAISNHVVKVHQ